MAMRNSCIVMRGRMTNCMNLDENGINVDMSGNGEMDVVAICAPRRGRLEAGGWR